MNPTFESSFGKVYFAHGVGRWLFLLISVLMSGVLLIGTAFPVSFARVTGFALLMFVCWTFRRTFLRIPAVETSEEGVTVRPDSERGRVFVRWEELEEVVVWYDGRGAVRTTMVGLWAGPDFQYDNYGLYPTVRPYRQLAYRPHLQPLLLRWSVPMARTSAYKISDLIEASGKQIPVYMSPLGSRELHPLVRPAPDPSEEGPAE